MLANACEPISLILQFTHTFINLTYDGDVLFKVNLEESISIVFERHGI